MFAKEVDGRLMERFELKKTNSTEKMLEWVVE